MSFKWGLAALLVATATATATANTAEESTDWLWNEGLCYHKEKIQKIADVKAGVICWEASPSDYMACRWKASRELIRNLCGDYE